MFYYKLSDMIQQSPTCTSATKISAMALYWQIDIVTPQNHELSRM